MVFARERHEEVLARLQRFGRVEVTELAEDLQVSEDTVRRDLRALAAAGHLQKTHGGAVALDPARMSWAQRVDVAAGAKQAVAEAAAGLVEPGQTLLLDAGSTIAAFARALRVRPLTVVTNSLDVAACLEEDPEVDLHLTAGQWDRRARRLAGSATVTSLARIRADWAFLGACALHPDVGATSVDPQDADVKIAMASAALRVAVLADHTKHEASAPHLVCPPGGIDVLVTDDPEAGEPWTRHGVQVLVSGDDAMPPAVSTS